MKVSHHNLLNQARIHAQSASFTEMLAIGQQIIEVFSDNVDALLDVGTLFLNSGYLACARKCFERVQVLVPDDFRPVINLANLEREAGNFAETRHFYDCLLEKHPDHPVIRRNALVSLEYNPVVTDEARSVQANAWGEWIIAKANGPYPRPACGQLNDRPLRIGYLSADLCQHTVGLFIKDILKAHDPACVIAFTYSAGAVNDWFTDAIRDCTQFRDVANLNDATLNHLIRQDKIDVLVDLSGHTAGSRLMVFAHRPAPVQVSWLGYFATTGLRYIDAVLLDEWHAPSGTESQFVETIMRLPSGRFCYQSVPWAPKEVAAPPFQSNGHITFGCFNNTAKLNAGVFDVWAKVLAAAPDSRLILKWRTFNDEGLSQSVLEALARREIASERIELRGPSFHADLLKEYAPTSTSRSIRSRSLAD